MGKILASTKLNKIALLCPVRGRPDYLYDYTESIADTATQAGRLSLQFYVDTDDGLAKQYQMLEHDHVLPLLNLPFGIGQAPRHRMPLKS